MYEIATFELLQEGKQLIESSWLLLLPDRCLLEMKLKASGQLKQWQAKQVKTTGKPKC